MVGQRSGQLVNQIHRCREESPNAMLTGLITEGQADMRFACTRRAHKRFCQWNILLLSMGSLNEIDFLALVSSASTLITP